MLLNKLQTANEILNNLITLTKKDIESIKEAKHEEIFNNIKIKENLTIKFQNTKNEIDNILSNRNKPLEEIFTPEEEKEFENFKNLLNEFNNQHKLFSKLSFSVTNFYNTLLNKIKGNKQITYEKENISNSQLKIKA